jgi:hypothetical protein
LPCREKREKHPILLQLPPAANDLKNQFRRQRRRFQIKKGCFHGGDIIDNAVIYLQVVSQSKI